MDAENQVYRDLQQHLNRLPAGFPATESGLDINLLKRLFTPEEARIAMHLSMKPEPIGRIHRRVKGIGMSIVELQTILDQMLYKGTLLVNEEGYDEKHYRNAAFSVGGIYNFQVNRLSRDFVDEYRQYQEETRSKAKSGARSILPTTSYEGS